MRGVSSRAVGFLGDPKETQPFSFAPSQLDFDGGFCRQRQADTMVSQRKVLECSLGWAGMKQVHER